MIGYMENSTAALAALIMLTGVAVIKLILWHKYRYLPPGPTGLPIVGCLFKLSSKPIHFIMNDFAQVYGNIFSLQLGSRLTVILHDQKAIYECFVKKARQFAGRPDLGIFAKTRRGYTGLSMSTTTKRNKKNRQITIKAMHEMLTDTERLNRIMQQEASKMVSLFTNLSVAKKSFDPVDEFYKVVPSLAMRLIFDHDCGYDDKDLIDLVNLNREWFESAEGNNPADYFKFLEKFPNKKYEAIEASAISFYNFILRKMSEHNSDNKSLLNSYLRLYRDFVGCEILPEGENMELARLVADMLGGALDTVPLTLAWSVLYLSKQKDVIENCRKEISELIGGRQLCVEDEKNLPYFCATLYEVLRLASTAPLGVPHCTTEDVVLGDYIIPKNTMVFANLWAVNRDKALWEEPEKIHPENFLTSEGVLDKTAIRKLATFSSGVRKCPGEKLAFSELFLILGTFLANFDFQIENHPENMDPSHGLTSQPKPYTIKLTGLNNN